MKKRELLPAIQSEPILGKSKIFIRRAVARKESGDLDEYQLWASLALELLGKAALSAIHPSLIVDPTHSPSLFAASGITLSTDIKTIAAHTLFERLRHLTSGFDENVKGFCNAIAQRRNVELHSGEAPFRAMRLEVWEAQFWHAAQLILDTMSASLEEWLGADQAKAPKELLRHAQEARRGAVMIRIQRARERFSERKKADRERALADASGKEAYHYRGLFRLLADKEWETACPACGGKAFLAGVQVFEEVVDTTTDEEGAWESVETHYQAEEFHCPVCDLLLEGTDDIATAELPRDFSEVETREREYEPDYGNC